MRRTAGWTIAIILALGAASGSAEAAEPGGVGAAVDATGRALERGWHALGTAVEGAAHEAGRMLDQEGREAARRIDRGSRDLEREARPSRFSAPRTPPEALPPAGR